MNGTYTQAERAHVGMVKALEQCSVCDERGPVEAHHIEQGRHFCCVAVCTSCHRGPLLGLHGQRRMWKLKKMTELDALNVTIGRLLRGLV